MTETADGNVGLSQDLFPPSTRTSIAQLSLGCPDSDSSPYVKAIVSLIWPYSNKNRLLSLLLAEPDVRLRSAKGQVKVTFHGSGAREVAQSQVGIGDIVRLRLEGATWTDTGDAVLTPGKKVNWDLHFKNRVILDVKRKDNLLATIDYEGSDTPPPTQKATSLQVNGYHDESSIAFSTVAPAQSKRISSGSFIDASLDPFVDDDGFVLGKGRKRTKFGRTSGSWRLVDEGEDNEQAEDQHGGSEFALAPMTEVEVPIPTVNTNVLTDVIVLDDSSSPEPSPVETNMPPPLNPFRRPPEKHRELALETEHVTTPRLHPLALPGLPMVSPLVKAVGPSVGYFGTQPSAPSELDTISIATTSPGEQEFVEPPLLTEPERNDVFEANERSTEDDTAQPSEVRPGPATSNLDEAPSPTFSAAFEARSPVFNKAASSPPFGFATGGFTGFAPQLSPANSLQGFGAPAAQSSFAAPTSSFGSPTGFASFGSSMGFGPSAGFGAVGFGFGAPATATKGTPFAVNQRQLVPQVPFDDLSKQEQDRLVPTNERPLQSPVVQGDLDALRHERSQSQQTDDDMYGPALPRQQSQSAVSVISGSPVSMHHNWQERLDVTAVDVETGNLASPPFPFPRMWNEKQQRQRRRSQRSLFLDGARDDVSEPDEDARTSSESASSQTTSEEGRISESVNSVQNKVNKSPPAVASETAPTFEAMTKAQIAMGPILELEGRTDIHSQTMEPQGPQIVSDDEDLEQSATTTQVHRDLSAEPPSGVPAMGGELADNTSVEEVFNPQLLTGGHLLTPANTQQDIQNGSSLEPLQQAASLQMPPTPENTQESASRAMFHLDGTNDFRSLEEDKDNMEVSSYIPEQHGQTSSDPSRKAVHVPAVSSSYFTSRGPQRLSLERQIAAPVEDESLAREDIKRKAVTEPPVVEAASKVRQLDELASLSPRHVKRLDNLPGVVTPLSYYTPLSNLDEHFNQQIDVLAICTAKSGVPTRSEAGPKDYNVTLHLADSFLERAKTVTAQVFRPYKQALPVVQRGDAILLRSFKVQSQKRKIMLLSTSSSAWGVFLSNFSAKDVEYWDLRIDVRGPPVESGPEESVYATKLLKWWQADGNLVHPAMQAGNDDDVAQTNAQQGQDQADATGDRAELVTNIGTNGNVKVNSFIALPIEPPRTTRSSRRINNRTDNTDNHDQTREHPAALVPVFEPISPTIVQRPRRKMNRTDSDANSDKPLESSHAHPTSPARTTRSSRRAANRADNTANEYEAATPDTIEPLPEISSPKTGRRTRRSTSVLSTTPELSRSLRSQSTVHELRDGTKYVDGHVPTKKDGMHELRDGTKYVDENISPAGKAPSEREESVVHELRDGTNYIDQSKSPEVRRSARNRRGGAVVHELRDGAKYTDGRDDIS